MKLILTNILGLILATQVYAAQTGNDCSSEKHYPLVSKTELNTLIEKKAVTVVDVNSIESYESTKIPTAIHYGSHEKDFTKVLPTDKNALIVAYCGGEKCTAWKKAAEAACQAGYKNVKHFKPGITGWNKT